MGIHAKKSYHDPNKEVNKIIRIIINSHDPKQSVFCEIFGDMSIYIYDTVRFPGSQSCNFFSIVHSIVKKKRETGSSQLSLSPFILVGSTLLAAKKLKNLYWFAILIPFPSTTSAHPTFYLVLALSC
jgi:hypothetical protein